MALRSPDLAPGGIEALRTPFERNRQSRIESVKIGQEIGFVRLLGERAMSTAQRAPRPGEGCCRSASSSETASRQFMPLPVAPSHGVPGRLVSSLKTSEASWALSKRKGVRSSTSARLASTVCRNAARRRFDGGKEVHGFMGVSSPRHPVLHVGHPPGPTGARPAATVDRPGSCVHAI